MKNIADMKTAEILAEYNGLTGKNVKKFSSRKAGEKQLTAARAAKPHSNGTPAATNGDIQPKNKKRSAAQRESWNDAKVAKKRAQRDGVHVTGVGDFKSVKAAFIAQRLPLGKHIPFRALLKKEGTANFEHNDKKIHFSIKNK